MPRPAACRRRTGLRGGRGSGLDGGQRKAARCAAARRLAAVAFLLVLLALLAPPAPAQPPTPAAGSPTAPPGPTPAEERGRRLYRSGESPSGGEVTALMGEARVEVPASALPCASCHGADGRGRPEGGIEPTDLTWDALTRPYTVRTASGRERGPYTPRLLVRAITLGIDSAGNPIDPVMPRYRLSRQDADDLVAYLQRLGRDHDPGLADDAVRVGVLLPPAGDPALAATAATVRRVLTAYAAETNRRGGVYGRRLELAWLPLPADPAERPAAVEAWLDERPVFALAASFLAGADRELADLAERREVPLIGPFTFHPDESFPLERFVFHLHAGLAGQARALVEHAADHARSIASARSAASADRSPADRAPTAPPPAALLLAEDPRLEPVAAALAERAAEHAGHGGAWSELRRIGWPPGRFDAAATAAGLAAAEVEVVFLVASADEARALLAAAAALGWAPSVHLLGPLAGGAVAEPVPGWRGRVVLAFPTLPQDRTESGLERLREATGGAALAPGTTTLAAFAALDLLVEGLERAGRDVSRERLVAALEALRDHRTGVLPPLTYGVNRRIGARGAWTVELDSGRAGEAAPRVRWIDGV